MNPLGPFYREVSGFPMYRVGLDGSVWSCRLKGSKIDSVAPWWQMVPASNGKSGHRFVRFRQNGRCKKVYVHRLVLEAFTGACPEGQECLHADGDPSNNEASNLRWGTRAENCADTASHGRAHRGERHRFAKLKDADIPIIFELRDGVPGTSFADLGIFFGVSEATVRAAYHGHNWKWKTGS